MSYIISVLNFDMLFSFETGDFS